MLTLIFAVVVVVVILLALPETKVIAVHQKVRQVVRDLVKKIQD